MELNDGLLCKLHETWIQVYEKMVLRTMYGPKCKFGEEYITKSYVICKWKQVIGFIKVNRLRWAGYVRMI